ncbi:hypothetical protein DP116_15935 [Brasilonema bromeliae SPC951]|uniref:Transposase n=1 Tax=Brasilonema bromeliae SPC951 TaxID=385972 RepID=A0ABX1PBR6_9CYAN|nr:hypothetical protein [Brasilonema bromeliae SPC951]
MGGSVVNKTTYVLTVNVSSLNIMTLIGYTEEIKIECLEMYVNGSGFRAIERVKKVHHTTVINWVRQLGDTLPDIGVLFDF